MTPTAIAIVVMTVLAMSSVLAFVLVQNTGPRARLKVRLAAIAGDAKDGSSLKKGAQQKGRSRSISIKSKLEEAGGGQASRRADLHLRIEQAGMSTSIQTFYIASAVSGTVAATIYLVLGYVWWGALPVATTIFFVSTSCVSPLDDLIETFPGALIVPRPSITVTLFVFISERTPLLNVFTTLFLRSCIFARSTRAPSITMPCFAASFLTNMKWSLDVSSA